MTAAGFTEKGNECLSRIASRSATGDCCVPIARREPTTRHRGSGSYRLVPSSAALMGRAARANMSCVSRKCRIVSSFFVMSSSSNPHDDPRLDFCSPQFDPLLALYAADISIPVPNIRPLDNIASFAAKFGVSTIASFLMMIPPSIGSAVRRSKPQINPCRSLLQLHMCQLRPKRSATQPVTIVTSRKPPSTSTTTNPCHRFQQTSKEPHTPLAIMLSRCPLIHLSMQQLARSRVVRLVV